MKCTSFTDLFSFEFVPVGFGFFQRSLSCVSLVTKYIEENIGVCSRSSLIPSVNLSYILNHCVGNNNLLLTVRLTDVIQSPDTGHYMTV